MSKVTNADRTWLDRKRALISSVISDEISGEAADEIVKTLMTGFVELTPPGDSAADRRHKNSLEVVEMSGKGPASSKKLGNVVLSWKRLFNEICEIVPQTAGAIVMPWVLPFTAISVWNRLHALCEITIEPIDATVLRAMWVNCDENSSILKRVAFQESKMLAETFGQGEIGELQFERVLRRLISLKCINVGVAEGDKGSVTITLIEEVHVTS